MASDAEQSASCPGPVSIVASKPSNGLITPSAMASPALPASAPLSGKAEGAPKVPVILSGERRLKILLSLGCGLSSMSRVSLAKLICPLPSMTVSAVSSSITLLVIKPCLTSNAAAAQRSCTFLSPRRKNLMSSPPSSPMSSINTLLISPLLINSPTSPEDEASICAIEFPRPFKSTRPLIFP